jgi:malyl-CoA/(S)-citramalyl-CoA lyase
MKPRRSNLSVPGHVEKMHQKARDSAADVVMFDLEDSVPVDQKQAARAQVIESLLTLDWHAKTVTVRCNALDTSFGVRDLIDIVENAGQVLDAVVVPKVNHPGDIHFVHRLLEGIEMDKQRLNRIGIEATIESAEGLENVSLTAKASDRMISLVFGIADYSASIGTRLSSVSGHGEAEEDVYPGHRWHFPLSRIIMAAKANGLLVMDAPFGNFKDLEGVRRSAIMSNALGCDGKWVIHPGQIDVINAVFSPSAEEIERARMVIEAYEVAVESGRGAVSLDGSMVDNATIRLARRLWEQAKHLGLLNKKQ